MVGIGDDDCRIPPALLLANRRGVPDERSACGIGLRVSRMEDLRDRVGREGRVAADMSGVGTR